MVRKELRRKGELGDVDKIKSNIMMRSDRLAEHSVKCTDLIMKYSINVMRDGMTIFVHSSSRTVLKVLQQAAERGIRIQVITTEC